MEYKSDFMMMLEVLEDEMKGIEDYKKCMEMTEDTEFKDILNSIIADEKKHANAMLRVINERSQKILL